MYARLVTRSILALWLTSSAAAVVVPDEIEPSAPPAAVSPYTLQQHAQQMRSINRAVAVITPTEGHRVRGVVWFIEQGNQVRVIAQLENLPPNSKHGFHVHEYGDLTSPDGASAGDHYNPEMHQHAVPPGEPRHAGDLGNLQTDAEGNARYDALVPGITIAGLTNPIIGRAVVVHENQDVGAQPSGNAGARIGLGVIGIANPKSQPPTAPSESLTPPANPNPPPPPISN